ncbi:MAG: hypothetical protein ACRD4U_03885 [Candidatus Acidiferrales bacterium]
MREATAVILVVAFLSPMALSGAVRGKDVMYVGGTIANLPEATTGRLDYQDEKVLRFTSDKGSFEIPYDRVTSLEYGQKAGRRLGVALTITIWALFSKKRKHFMTIGFNDENDKPQGVVLELPKGLPRTVIAIIEARSGVKCDYESEEARKHVHG